MHLVSSSHMHTHHTSHITHHSSHVTHHTSHITHAFNMHTSHVTNHKSHTHITYTFMRAPPPPRHTLLASLGPSSSAPLPPPVTVGWSSQPLPPATCGSTLCVEPEPATATERYRCRTCYWHASHAAMHLPLPHPSPHAAFTPPHMQPTCGLLLPTCSLPLPTCSLPLPTCTLPLPTCTLPLPICSLPLPTCTLPLPTCSLPLPFTPQQRDKCMFLCVYAPAVCVQRLVLRHLPCPSWLATWARPST